MAPRTLIGMIIVGAIGRAVIAGDVPVLQFGQIGGGGGGGRVYSLTEGWEFDVEQTVTVTRLGVFDSDRKGLSQETPVAIWDSNDRTMTSVVVPSGEAAELIGHFRYAAVDHVQLKPGRRYVIGAFYTPKSKELVRSSNGGLDFTSLGPIRWTRARHGRTKELAVPHARETRFDWLPGSFGPNFAIAEDTSHKRTPKMTYKARLVQPDIQWETVAVVEQPDGTHINQSRTQICLFATRDGKLTQIVFDGRPIGTGYDAFRRLATEIEIVNPRTENRPLIEIAITAGVGAEDLRLAMLAAHYAHFDPNSSLSVGRGCDVLRLCDTHPFQQAKENRFIVPDRFRDAGAYVEDCWTGLLWQKDGGISGKKNFYEAEKYAEQLELGDLKNWRLPTRDEIATIFPANFLPFSDTRYNTNDCCAPGEEYPSYWTSEIHKNPQGDSAVLYQWYTKGGPNGCLANLNYVYVRCAHDPSAAEAARNAQR